MTANFRRYLFGYTTSELGSAMSPTAITFAILDHGGSGTDLGYVMAARIVPIVLFLLGGGVIADRIGSRQVMLAADAVRCVTQAGFAIVLALGYLPLWLAIVLVAAWGVGEGFFSPSISALIPVICPAEELRKGNSLLATARSAADVLGPAIAGVLVATVGSALVVGIDAATYAVSVISLASLRISAPPVRRDQSAVAALREGWTEFRSHAWLWVTTIQFALFNLLVWAPFRVMGPVLASRHAGGARIWGLTMALYGGGAVLGGLAMLRIRTRRPLFVATIASFGWALPSAALAAGEPTVVVLAAAFLAGIGSAVCLTLHDTTLQREVAPEARARISSYGTFGSFVLGPLGLAAAGPVAAAIGVTSVLVFGAVWQVIASGVVLAVPAVRNVLDTPEESKISDRSTTPAHP